ncbi:acyclic terpene utilization AtuA family protein [Actinophytocola sp.]|uniref:acyclic terpene utilization AtuA family protein n=1 Tax=Actinophytocola sp. TaxID=1872138 RepID=UPI0025C3735A|nr:acyclic terpene utilization AtuA family protein [Actinophytocola sp.]
MTAGVVRIGCGAGYAGDRLEAAAELAERGDLDYLVLECLAERTLALAYARKRRDPSLGYDAGLRTRMETLLPTCARGTTLVSNLGAANPRGALDATVEIAGRLGLTGMLIGAVDGDNVLEQLDGLDRTVWETGQPIGEALGEVDWAHAYLGADALLPALRAGCRVVLAGRIADPSLFVAPLMHEFGWAADDWHRLGRGTMVGHLLECGSSVTGGYFAEPGRKDVPDLTGIGMPIAEVDPDGTAVVCKTPGTGGQVSERTCKEQLLYEIHDPAAYLTPDVTADFSRAALAPAGQDRVAVSGGSGRVRPDELKVVMGVRDGFIGEGEMSYAGPGALSRARLSAEIVRDRLDRQGVHYTGLRTEFIGYDSVLGPIARRAEPPEPFEVRLRIAARTATERAAAIVGAEVEALTITGPAGGAGKRSSARAVVSVRSTSIPRSLVHTTLHTATT